MLRAYHSPGGGGSAAPEVTSRDPGFSAMSEGFIPSAEPATPEPAAPEPQPSGTPAPAAAPGAEGRPAGAGPSVAAPTAAAPGAAPAAAEPKKYRVLGKEYSVAELEAAGLLDKLDTMATQAEQVAHYQRLFERERQAREELDRQAREQRPAAPAAEDQGVPTEQLMALYSPSIKAAVDAGVIEPDVATAYPKTAARLFYLSDLVSRQGKVLAQVLGSLNQVYQGGRGQQVRAALDQMTDGVSKKGPMFEPLADPNTRQEFYAWLGEKVNPPASMLSEEFLARMWAAYKHTDWIGVAEAAAQAQRAGEEEKRRQAQGEGGGSRPPASPEKTKKEKDLEEMSEGFLPPLR
jgi:hypothetical protein